MGNANGMASRALLVSVVLVVLLILISVGDTNAGKSYKSSGSRSSSSSRGGSKSTYSSKSGSSSSGSSGGNSGFFSWFGGGGSKSSKPSSAGSASAGSLGGASHSKSSKPSSAPADSYKPQKPSAPPADSFSKQSASHAQSGYPASTASKTASAPPAYSAPGSATGYNQGSGAGYGNKGAPPAYTPHNQGYAPPAYGGNGHSGYGAPPAYGSQGGGYHAPPAYGGYGAAGGASHGYNPYGASPGSPYGGYSHGHSFQSAPGHGYNPSYGASSYSAQPQTVVLQGSKPSFGQMAKEAFVYASVNAAVQSTVNRVLPGGISGHNYHSYGSPSSSGVVPSHTQITNNYYYNNDTSSDRNQPSVVAPAAPSEAAAGAPSQPAGSVPAAAPAANPGVANAGPEQAANPPAQQQQQGQEQPPPPPAPEGPIVTDDELKQFTNSLFKQDTNNAMKYIEMRLQGQKTDDSVTDDAPNKLLEVKPEAYEIPTVKAVLALHDNYELDVSVKETTTAEERLEEAHLVDTFMATNVMKSTMKFLADKGFVADDEYEFKETLKRMWFSLFKRTEGEPSSSGFETIFLAEKFDNEIIGLHNWIYFAKQEEAKKLDYLGYIKKLEFTNNGAIVKGRSKLNDIVQPITTIFVGTSPELEMALYTVCFFTRPNYICPVVANGADFLVVANRVNYFGKEIIISGFPDI